MWPAFKSSDLASDERAVLERLVGRPLQSNDVVQLVVHKLDEPQNGEAALNRREAADRIRELSKGKTLGGATARELIDEGRRF